MIYVYLYFLFRASYFYNQSIIRLDIAYIYSCCHRAHLLSDSSVCPCVNNFTRTSERGFVFMRLLSSCCYFIPHSIIMIDYISVFTDDFSIYVCLFALMYISPIRYAIYREVHVSTKTFLAWNFIISRVVRRAYRKGRCR